MAKVSNNTSPEQASRLRMAYSINLFMVSGVGLIPLLSPSLANKLLFQHAFVESEAFRVLGALWLTVALLSGLGLRAADPRTYSPVLLSQVVYKTIWLAVATTRSLLRGSWADFPFMLALTFAPFVVFLPAVIPWSYLLGARAKSL